MAAKDVGLMLQIKIVYSKDRRNKAQRHVKLTTPHRNEVLAFT